MKAAICALFGLGCPSLPRQHVTYDVPVGVIIHEDGEHETCHDLDGKDGASGPLKGENGENGKDAHD